jgi:crossover junction endodeoxyribonuclease RuvC
VTDPLADSGSSPILGVDPGITGAIAALYPDGTILADDIPTVGGSVDVDTLVRRVRELAPRLAIIEKAQAMPRQGVVSVFKYGTAFGALCAVTAICEIPTHLVSPRKWKTHFGLDADKEKSRALAIRLWPGCGYFSRVKDHGRSEAALIARYGAETIATNFAAPSGKGEGGRLLPPTTHR